MSRDGDGLPRSHPACNHDVGQTSVYTLWRFGSSIPLLSIVRIWRVCRSLCPRRLPPFRNDQLITPSPRSGETAHSFAFFVASGPRFSTPLSLADTVYELTGTIQGYLYSSKPSRRRRVCRHGRHPSKLLVLKPALPRSRLMDINRPSNALRTRWARNGLC